jgi:hypothetical protein
LRTQRYKNIKREKGRKGERKKEKGKREKGIRKEVIYP